MRKVVAVLETMYDWRGMTTGAGYDHVEAPRHFTINPYNHSGKRLYKLVGNGVDLVVTNACRELGRSANDHGTPNPEWLRENLILLEPFDVLLVCGKVATATYEACGYHHPNVIKTLHPAARTWTAALIQRTKDLVREMLESRPSFIC